MSQIDPDALSLSARDQLRDLLDNLDLWLDKARTQLARAA